MEPDDVTLLAENIRKSNKLSSKETQFLKLLSVRFRNPVLPQHKIETRAGSHSPTNVEIKKFEEIVPIKRGCFDPAEDIIITDNWEAFCKLHGWDSKKVHPFLILREGRKAYIRSKNERRNFVRFLADGLPNRTLFSVYQRFRNLYEVRFQRRFRPDEDKMILNHLDHNPNLNGRQKYGDLARILKRTRAAIWRRYRLLKRKQKQANSR